MIVSYLALLLVLIAMGAVVFATIALVMAVALLRPPRMSDGRAVFIFKRLSPADLGLEFEEVTFSIRDERTHRPLDIAGWWMPHPSGGDRTVVLLHGYADAKIGAIAWAPLWHELGFHILAIDQRAHGESGGTFCTAGDWERHDLLAVLDRLRAQFPGQSRQIVLFGVSLGGATALAAAALQTSHDIAAIVLESPPANFSRSAMTQMDRLGAPGAAFQRAALWLAQVIARCDFAAVRPIDLLEKVSPPVLIIAPLNDPMVSADDRAALQQALSARQRPATDAYWPVDAGHVLALEANPADYDQRLRQFIECALGNSTTFSPEMNQEGKTSSP